MGKINLLDKNVAELIAAGEVIERPASIVKELLENSIDAGATAVTVEIRRGGVSYIRVTDNGSGIFPEDIPTAFLRHATSKIRLSDDLDSIATLGFRGEALASIAAVSRLELVSKTRESPLGARIRLEGGEPLSLEEAGCPDGTTIVVTDLFYNVPARLKFLRKDVSEGNTVASLVERLALSHPEVSVKFISDRKTRLHSPGDGELLSAVHAVFGADFASALLPVDYGCDGISVTGYTSRPEQSRSNRSMQHFFVNHRYIHSKVCLAALEEGYKNAIMVGKYPFCVLNISLPYHEVDVNVHPAKTEVRFQDDRSVYNTIYFAVKSALSRDDILKKAAQTKPPDTVPNLLSSFRNEEAAQTVLSVERSADSSDPKPVYVSPVPAPPLILNDGNAEYRSSNPVSSETSASPPEMPSRSALQNPSVSDYSDRGIVFVPETVEEPQPKKAGAPVQVAAPELPKEEPSFSVRVIGELFQTYLLFEGQDVFFLLDKHAAHERIVFEKLKVSVTTAERQLLLKPVVVQASAEEREALFENESLLAEMGFVFEDFGNHTLLIREVPLILAEYDAADMILDIARKLIENRRDISSNTFENLLHSIACRSAIKAHDPTSIEELTELLRQVYANDEIRHCPHGRPVVVAMTRSELERKFGRIQ